VHTKKINALLDKYIKGTISAAEKQELLDVYNNSGNQDAEYPDDHWEVRDRILMRLNKEIQTVRPIRSYRNLRNIAAVTIIFIFFGVAMYISTDPSSKAKRMAGTRQLTKPILPGGNVAVLTLGNGESILLNGASNGRLAVQGNTAITKNESGRISYHVISDGADQKDEPIVYNTITTPAGGQFRVTLPDGTDVWLNAASSLKYPSRFGGTERCVELHGEAYFEVRKNKKLPFTVRAEQVDIRVLGTHFNVMAYTNEPSVNTTLLEGAVSLSSARAHQLLAPGQQALASKTAGDIVLRNVNVEDAVAWKNGYFSFRRENLKTAMHKIARWYNVEVQYIGNPDNKILGGSISRTEDINKLLNYLALTGIAKFNVEGRRIIVTCK